MRNKFRRSDVWDIVMRSIKMQGIKKMPEIVALSFLGFFRVVYTIFFSTNFHSSLPLVQKPHSIVEKIYASRWIIMGNVQNRLLTPL